MLDYTQVPRQIKTRSRPRRRTTRMREMQKGFRDSVEIEGPSEEMRRGFGRKRRLRANRRLSGFIVGLKNGGGRN